MKRIILILIIFNMLFSQNHIESTKYEPANSVTMVNKQTGNFVYNIPLMEIPGPGVFSNKYVL
jgi:hypothetical protein